MKAFIKRFNDENGKEIMATIWAISPTNPDALAQARSKIYNYIGNYVGNRGHNVFMHTENDTVAAVITFGLDKYEGEIINI
ncbi:MAG: hypothetical protein NT084_10645 [Bacteroidetes bacterium]|nr:hypothetical protein [Bacteroidota bacterium]